MLLIIVSIVTLSLVCFATSNPIDGAATAGVRIPLTRRSSLTKPDGTFDLTRAIAHTVAVKNKHRQNLINLEHNVGKEAFNDGAEIKPLTLLPASLRKRQSESLTDELNDSEWAGMMQLGTPATSFLIDFDTGSSDLWVPSSLCQTLICMRKDKYTASSSSTSVQEPGLFSIEYGDGSTVMGPIYTDTVSVAGITAKSQYFSAVTFLSSSFADTPIDGILGLAFPSISNIGRNPFFISAINQSSVHSGQFAFYLASTGSELYLGGTNTTHYTGAIEYHSLSSLSGFWQIGGASVLVGTSVAVSSFETIIDSGTTVMYGPVSSVANVYSRIPNAQLYDPGNGLWSYPCNSAPSVAFNWGGRNWAISNNNFNLGQTQPGSSQCVGALIGQDIGLGSNVWLLGDSWMKNVYTTFNTDNNSIGFAALV